MRGDDVRAAFSHPGQGLAPGGIEAVERQQLLLERLAEGRVAAVQAGVALELRDPESGRRVEQVRRRKIEL